MHYKGYTASIEYNHKEICLVGRILGIKDSVGFQGHSLQDMQQLFQQSVDNYLDHCAKNGHKPNKPYSGKLMLRLTPELHARLALFAQVNKKSINKMVSELLHKYIEENKI